MGSRSDEQQEHKRSFLYTLLGYLAIMLVIALMIGAGLYWFVIIPKRFPSPDAFAKLGLTLFTALTFGG
jgi:hypothetical protein